MHASAEVLRGLAPAWRAFAAEPAIVAELEAIFTLIADQVEARAPVCESSGRCCNFDRTGHRLFTTGLEAAYTLSRLPAGVACTPEAVAEAITRGDCPFLVHGRCGVHTIKPTGCRVYFCDPTATEWQQDLSERVQALLRSTHERHGVAYVYAEWRSLLAAFAQENAPGGGG